MSKLAHAGARRTTPAGFARLLEDASTLSRCFRPVTVSPLSNEESLEVLRGLRDRYEAHHRAVIQDFPDLSGHQVYACGVPVMVEAAQRDFIAQRSLPEDEFYCDSFTTQADLARDGIALCPVIRAGREVLLQGAARERHLAVVAHPVRRRHLA